MANPHQSAPIHTHSQGSIMPSGLKCIFSYPGVFGNPTISWSPSSPGVGVAQPLQFAPSQAVRLNKMLSFDSTLNISTKLLRSDTNLMLFNLDAFIPPVFACTCQHVPARPAAKARQGFTACNDTAFLAAKKDYCRTLHKLEIWN